ncbi:MAG TPA: hypothetical protein EYN67_09445 [Flavobacteriales bacterium]|nr:hypothetical protein [Flavobacteriales bacterium]
MSDDCKRVKTKAAIDIKDLPKEVQKKIAALPEAEADILGIAAADGDQFDAPNLMILPNERLIKKGNASIRFGKDRTTNRFTGFGGKGQSHCAAIDIVAGTRGWCAKKRNKKNEETVVNPDFKLDSARVYISQKADVDTYFGLVKGAVGNTSFEAPRSTVALKADTVRLIARENIKLVTRTDSFNSQGGELSNSLKKSYGINLIAMNDDEGLQSMVKGENLVECLEGIIQMITNLATIVENKLQYDQDFFRAVQTHTHMTAFYGSESAPDFKRTMMAGVECAVNETLNCLVPQMLDAPLDTAGVINDYLSNGGGAKSKKYILSLYNKAN